MLQSHCDLVSPHQRTNAQFHFPPPTNETREAEFKSFPRMFLMLLMLPLTVRDMEGKNLGVPQKTWDIPESTKALGKTLIQLNAL